MNINIYSSNLSNWLRNIQETWRGKNENTWSNFGKIL